MKEQRKFLQNIIKLVFLCVMVVTFINLTALSAFATPRPGSGDIDDDGYVGYIDFNMLYFNLASTPEQQAAADVNQDGEVNTDDYDELVKHVTTTRFLPSTNRIAFTSDVHGDPNLPNDPEKSPGIAHLSQWLNDVANNHTESSGLDQIFFGGDYNNDVDNNRTEIETACKNTVKGITKFADTPLFFARGNHDTSVTTFNFNQGLVVDPATHNYGVYIMGITLNSTNPQYISDDLTALSSILNSDNLYPWTPFFIVSHLPLHAYINNNGYIREYTLAGDLITLLNAHPNVIFLYGHNHSQGDPMYSTPKQYGDILTYKLTPSPLTAQINFTYLTMGSMRDGGTTSIPGESQNIFGLLVTMRPFSEPPLIAGTHIDFELYHYNGNCTISTIKLINR